MSNFENDSIPVIKLTKVNYHAWRSSMLAILQLRGFEDQIYDPQAAKRDPTAELRARQILLSSVDDSTKFQLEDCSTAYDIMGHLEDMGANYSKTNVGDLLREEILELLYYKKDPKNSMSEHIVKLEGMREEFKKVGQPQSDEVFMNWIIASLPAGYETLIEIWDSILWNDRCVPDLILEVLKREQELIRRRPDTKAGGGPDFLWRPYSGAPGWRAYSTLSTEDRRKVTKCLDSLTKARPQGSYRLRECRTKQDNLIPKPDSASE